MLSFSSHVHLEVDQVRETLHNLYQLRHVASTGDEVYVADHAIATSAEGTTKQKVYNYMSTWCGWSYNLDRLPILTKKITTFIKSDSSFQISEKEVVEAIQGLGSLLSVKGQNSQLRDRIEEGLSDLNTALEIIESRQQGRAIESLAQEEKKEKESTWLSYGWSHYIPNLSLPGLASMAASQLSHTLSSWGYFSKNAIHPLYSKAEEKVRAFIYPHAEENPPALLKTIREFMVDPSLTKKVEVTLSETAETITVPSQFFIDCTRFRKIILNNETLFDLKAQPVGGDEIAKAMIQVLGQKAFERLGTVVHQSLVADQVVAWMLDNWPQEWYECGSPFSKAHFMQAEGFCFTIDVQDQLVKVDAKIPLVLNAVADGVDGNDAVQAVGYVMIHRQLTFVKAELERDMEGLPMQERLPSLTAKHAISHFCSTLDEAHSYFS